MFDKTKYDVKFFHEGKFKENILILYCFFLLYYVQRIHKGI